MGMRQEDTLSRQVTEEPRVQEPVSDAPSEEVQLTVDASDDDVRFVQDENSSDILLAGDSEEPAGAETPDAPQAEPPPVAAEQALPETPEPTESATKPRMYSTDEVSRMQSSWDRQIAEANKRAAEAERTRQAVAGRIQLEAQVADFEGERRRQYEQQGYGAEDAQARARMEAQNAVAGWQLQQANVERENMAKQTAAVLIAQEHGLDRAALPTLLAYNSPDQMVAAAFAEKQRVETIKARDAEVVTLRKEIEALKRQRVPAGGPANTLETGVTEVAPDTDESVSNRAMRTPVEDWTPEMHAAMARSAGWRR